MFSLCQRQSDPYLCLVVCCCCSGGGGGGVDGSGTSDMHTSVNIAECMVFQDCGVW